MGGPFREAFCDQAVFRRLHGKVDIYRGLHVEGARTILQRSAGIQEDLFLHLYGNITFAELTNIFPDAMYGKVRYIMEVKCAMLNFHSCARFPNMVMLLSRWPDDSGLEGPRCIAYRPPLLGRRNIVEIVRVVFRRFPYVSEVELDRLGREAAIFAQATVHLQGVVYCHAWRTTLRVIKVKSALILPNGQIVRRFVWWC